MEFIIQGGPKKSWTEIVLNEVRLTYAYIWEPQVSDSGVTKYSAGLMINKNNSEAVDMLTGAIDAIKKDCIEKGIFKPAAEPKVEIHDGSQLYAAGEKPRAYDNFFIINARNVDRPSLVDQDVLPIKDQKEIYSGVWTNTCISVYYTKNGGVHRICFGLQHIQKVRDDEHLDGRSNVLDVFKAIAKENGSSEFDK